jgi:hypothetical protein
LTANQEKIMKRKRIYLAFALGCVTAIAVNFALTVIPQGKTRPDPLESRLKLLEQRAVGLEQGSTVPQPSKKVTAPFYITNPAGTRIFDVTTDGANVYFAGKPVATMSGTKSGGLFVAKAASGNSSVWFDASLGTPGFAVVEGDKNRIELGRAPEKGTYRLKFLSGSDKVIAGIGQSASTPTGLALVADSSGNIKARLAVTDGGKGLIDVFGVNKLPIAQLTEGSHKGGLLLICQPDGCDTPMVEAGDAGGFGIVRVGPHGFNPGVTMLGLPGSVIAGKRK